MTNHRETAARTADKTFRIAPWYSLGTAPLRFLAAPAWGRVYKHKLGVKVLRDLPVPSWKRSDFAFILGSGPSINDLSDNHWAVIRRATSIGFNRWLAHPFVPDIYVFENLDDERRDLLVQRHKDYDETPLILKHFLTNFSPRKHQRRLHMLSSLPPAIRQNIYMSSDAIIPGRSLAELDRSYRVLRAAGFFRPSNSFQWIPKRTASLTYLVALCARAGFRHIVLCGVDLNRPGYFYDPEHVRADAPDLSSLGPAPTSPLHETEDPRAKVLPISAVLRTFQHAVLDMMGVTLWVSHSGSVLSASMPVFDWLRQDVLT